MKTSYAGEYITIPNIITSLRLLVALCLPLFTGNRTIAFVLAAVVVIGDLEGLLARKLDQVTASGAFLDKLTDLVFVGIGFAAFVVTDLTSALLSLCIALSRILKFVLIKSPSKYTVSPVFTKLTYVAAYAIIFLAILEMTSAVLLAVLVAFFWLECAFTYYQYRSRF